MNDADVLIVGGGPAGSSLACTLARAGIDVHVVDRARFPRAKPCAEYLSPEASRLLASMGALDAPWGIAWAPDNFGEASGDLLIGNFGDGVINIFEPEGHGEFEHEGSLHRVNGNPIVIQGLWALQFGNDGPAGPSSTLFFTAGPAGETHGLFGSIEAQS